MKPAYLSRRVLRTVPFSQIPRHDSQIFGNVLRQNGSLLVWAFAGIALAAIPYAHVTAQQAQPASMEGRLPAATQSYMHWRGTKSLDLAKSKNRLQQLWVDPDFAPVRRSVLKQAYNSAWRARYSGPMSVDQLDSLSPLFENESIAGSMAPSTAPRPKTGKAGGVNTDDDVFVVYDVTGKEALVQKAIELMEKSAPGTPKVNSYAFGETKVESIQTGAGSLYWAQTGGYLVRASRKELEEDLIARFRAKTPAASSMGDDADWKRAKEHFLPGAILDVFVRTGKTPAASGASGDDFNRSKFQSAAHLDRAHALVASVSLSGEATRIRAVLVADTSAGSAFDIAGASGPGFETLQLARDSASYNVVRLNLPAIYQTIHGALLESLPEKQANALKGFDMLGAAMLGKPIPEVLALFRGEMAAITSAPDDPTYSDLYAVAIQKPDEVVALLRKTLGTMIEHEDHIDGITYLDLTSKSVDPQTKAPRNRNYFIAVTPQMVLVSPRKGMVRDAAARITAAPSHLPATALAADPDFQKVRALLPKNLSGLTYTQMSKLTWERDLSVMVKSAGKVTQAGAGAPGDADEDALRGVNLSVFARHLHWYAGGWWKAADGIYFDSYLQ